ncbi:DUF397 domain-containing protein [Streptomyces sp. NPDC002454]|uniref:DUF397 domain-containing protein n=1 Tax=Streptomyces sp. NPDC002490 TaxID=3154416 RepID=UPI00331696CF
MWFTSSYSNDAGGVCVEVAHLADRTGVRDTKDRARPALFVPHDAWRAFVGFAAEA